jgi:hypothetical protein
MFDVLAGEDEIEKIVIIVPGAIQILTAAPDSSFFGLGTQFIDKFDAIHFFCLCAGSEFHGDFPVTAACIEKPLNALPGYEPFGQRIAPVQAVIERFRGNVS